MRILVLEGRTTWIVRVEHDKGCVGLPRDFSEHRRLGRYHRFDLLPKNLSVRADHGTLWIGRKAIPEPLYLNTVVVEPSNEHRHINQIVEI